MERKRLKVQKLTVLCAILEGIAVLLTSKRDEQRAYQNGVETVNGTIDI